MVNKGDRYRCDTCGVVMIVEDPCGCSPCDVVCCGAPMRPVGKSAAKPKAKK
jgi:hypothetical protein